MLRTAPADALWVTRGPVFSQHAWRDAWITNLFRNESACLSSTLIRQAVAVTYALWPTIPAQGMITSVNPPIRALYAAASPAAAIGVPASGK